jgi:hypothetical protein
MKAKTITAMVEAWNWYRRSFNQVFACCSAASARFSRILRLTELVLASVLLERADRAPAPLRASATKDRWLTSSAWVKLLGLALGA